MFMKQRSVRLHNIITKMITKRLEVKIISTLNPYIERHSYAYKSLGTDKKMHQIYV